MTLEPVLALGGSYQELHLARDGSGDIFTCSGGALQRFDAHLQLRWSSKPIGAHWIATIEDLDEDGADELLTSNGRRVFILSASDGRILWSYDVGPPFSYGTYATMFQCERMVPGLRGKQFTVPCFSHKEVLLFDCSEGASNTRLLHKLWMNDAYHPTTVIGDVNGDGNPEIMIARLGGVYVFDPTSGKMTSSTQWKSDEERRRNYGHFELADTDGTGTLNAVIISDRVTRHIALLENDGRGNFSPRWDRFIEHIYPNDSTELRYCFASVSGLASRRIAISNFNSTIPDHWCTEILDPLTGTAEQVIEDQWLAGVTNNRLLLQHSLARVVPEFADISISDESDNVFADAENAQFAKRTRHYRGTRGQFKPEVFGQDDIWTVRDKALVISNEDSSFQLRTFDHSLSDWFLDSDEPFRVAAVSIEGPIVSTRSGEIVKLDGSSIKLGYHLTTEAHLSARPGTQVTSVNGVMVAPRTDGTLILKTKNVVKTLKGRGRSGYDNVYHDIPILSIGGKESIAVVDDEDVSHARLRVYDLHGESLMQIDLPQLPPSRLGSRIGVYDWQPFSHQQGEALYVAAYRSPSMNSECSLALLVGSGEVLWQTLVYGDGEFGRGIGPWGSSTLTVIDNIPSVVFCAKDTLIALSLEDGSFVRAPLLLTDLTKAEMQRQGVFKEQGFDTWSTIDDPFTAYGSVIARDLDNDGRDEYVIAGCFGGFGFLDHEFKPRWWKVSNFGDVLYRMPAIDDLDLDGSLELYQSHSDGTIRAYSMDDGRELGSIRLEGVASDLAIHEGNLIAATTFGSVYKLAWRNGELAILDRAYGTAAMGLPVLSDDGHVLIASASGELFSLR